MWWQSAGKNVLIYYNSSVPNVLFRVLPAVYCKCMSLTIDVNTGMTLQSADCS